MENQTGQLVCWERVTQAKGVSGRFANVRYPQSRVAQCRDAQGLDFALLEARRG